MQAILSKWAGPVALVVSCIAAAGSYALRAPLPAHSLPGRTAVQARVAISQALPQLDGAQLKASVVEVVYEPGGYSTPHSHPCPVIVYVLEGTLREQVQGEPEATYKAGESFYEPPNGVHMVSSNVSKTEPAKFLAYFVCDHETPLSVPTLKAKAGGGK
jgi:quercetin dioxygenase-like cupin family protein